MVLGGAKYASSIKIVLEHQAKPILISLPFVWDSANGGQISEQDMWDQMEPECIKQTNNNDNSPKRRYPNKNGTTKLPGQGSAVPADTGARWQY
jgi:hypothetical protein